MTTKQASAKPSRQSLHATRIVERGGVRLPTIYLRDPELVQAWARLVDRAGGNKNAAVATAIRLADDLMHPSKSTLAANSREG